MYHEEIALADVARVLEPIVVNSDAEPLDWCSQLEVILDSLKECRSLRDLLENGVLEQGRLLKESSGPLFYDPGALITFARFNFLVRRAFIRLLHTDQDAVVKAIEELDHSGVRSVDCRRAGFSAAESIGSLRLFAQNWRPLYQKDYSENAVNRSFEQLLALRADLEDSLAKLHKEDTESAPTSENSLSLGSPENMEKPQVEESQQRATASPELVAHGIPEPLVQPQMQAEESTIAAEGASDDPQIAPEAGASSTVARNDISSKKLELMDPSEPVPASAPVNKRASGAPSAGVPLPPEAEACLEAIWEQLIAAPPSRGRSMSTIVLKNTKVLLSSWEVSAFVSEGGQEAEDLRRAVVARAMIALAMDSRRQTGECASLDKALEAARAEASYFQGRVEGAKESKNVEAAVNLGISSKRLLSFIEEAEKLQP
jgi:hypothetical protein